MIYTILIIQWYLTFQNVLHGKPLRHYAILQVSLEPQNWNMKKWAVSIYWKKFSIIQEHIVYTSSATTAWRLIHFSFLLPVLSHCFSSHHDFSGGSDGKVSVYNAGGLDSIPGWGRSPGEGNGYLLQYSGLENSMDCKVHRVAKSRTWLSDFHFDAPLLWSRLPCSVWTVGLRKEWWKLGRVT